jgi:catechol 2,3-dioxygenase-like lactoylglutathione lyase family enzyme
VDQTEIDHVLVHVDDWEAANGFYGHVLGADLVESEEGRADPLGRGRTGWTASRSTSMAHGLAVPPHAARVR